MFLFHHLLLPISILLLRPTASYSHPSTSPGYLSYHDFANKPYTVTYDNRSLLLNNERTLFHSVGIHYPRFTPSQWEDILLKAVHDNYNMVQTYFFVNVHMPKQSIWPWNMEGSANLFSFLDKAKEKNLFVTLRIGPYGMLCM